MTGPCFIKCKSKTSLKRVFGEWAPSASQLTPANCLVESVSTVPDAGGLQQLVDSLAKVSDAGGMQPQEAMFFERNVAIVIRGENVSQQQGVTAHVEVLNIWVPFQQVENG